MASINGIPNRKQPLTCVFATAGLTEEQSAANLYSATVRA